MSNKTTLQSNNALISQSNTNLQALINTANALPDAGGSGGVSVETCMVTIVSNGVGEPLLTRNFVYGTDIDTNKIEIKYGFYSKDYTTQYGTLLKDSLMYIAATNVASVTGEGISLIKMSTTEGIVVLGINSNAPDEITITLNS